MACTSSILAAFDRLRRLAAVLAAIPLLYVASPAVAAPLPAAKLVRCGSDSCLRIAGQRANVDMTVRINGHDVRVDGEQHWEVKLPVQTVRAWSVPNAAAIELSLHDPQARLAVAESIPLPPGMLLEPEQLASLVVSVR